MLQLPFIPCRSTLLQRTCQRQERLGCSTAGTAGNALACRTGLTTSNVNAGPGPVRARCAQDVNLSGVARHCTGYTLGVEFGDRDTAGWGTSGRTVLCLGRQIWRCIDRLLTYHSLAR